MTVFVGLLRAVNVGGTGKLPMAELTELCTGLGFADVRTYIQSGNVVFSSSQSEGGVRSELKAALSAHMGRKVDVVVRTADDLERVLAANPFPEAEPSKVAVALSNDFVPTTLLDGISIEGGERVVLGKRELYIHYPNGMGTSKLKLPAEPGPFTVRNINTVTKLVAMSADGP